MSPRDIQNLFDYDLWATNIQLEAISKLSREQYVKDMGSSYGGLRGTLVHIYAAQRIWFERWTGGSPAGLMTQQDFPEFTGLVQEWSALREQVQQFIRNLTGEKLTARLAYRDLKGNPASLPLAYQMQHVVNHSTYHRGQITTMLRQMGVTPPLSVDLIGYYRKVDQNPE